jgi:hypothetical protein
VYLRRVVADGVFHCLDRLIIMTHVGRPWDKKTKTLTVKQDDAVDAVVGYLQRKLRIKFALPKFHVFDKEGIHDIDTSINWLIHDLKARKIGGIYLPNTRWFAVSTSLKPFVDANIQQHTTTPNLPSTCTINSSSMYITGHI